ncbi:MAG: hypothetical protein U0893_21050 [Chloroflexota bacterium]
MPFTVDDFEDLLRLLYERPEWRQRLREMILPPELFELPRIAQELADANQAIRERLSGLDGEQHATRDEVRAGFAQTGERFDRVEARLGGVETRLEGVEGRLGHVETDLGTFRTETTERFDRLEGQLRRTNDDLGLLRVQSQQTNTDLGKLKGREMEDRYRARISTFRDLIPNPVALSFDEMVAFLDGEVAAGRLPRPDARRIENTDFIVRGGESSRPEFLVVEVSWLVDEHDVRRAGQRAALLRKAGYQTQGLVAGSRILDDARTLSDRLGVLRIIDEDDDAAYEAEHDI